MEENANANKPTGDEPTSEVARLLKMLETQRAARPERGPSGLQTPAFRYGALVAIAVFGFGSLGLLEWFLSQIAKPWHPGMTGASQDMAPRYLHGNPPQGQ